MFPWNYLPKPWWSIFSVKKEIPASRCQYVTAAGNRCKRMTVNYSGYCWQHE